MSVNFANRLVMYSWHERGILESSADWVVVAPGGLVREVSTDGVQMVVELEGGTKFAAPLDSGHIVWIDSDGVAEVSTYPVTMKFVREIGAISATGNVTQIESVGSFVRALRTQVAAQGAGANRLPATTSADSKSEDDGKSDAL